MRDGARRITYEFPGRHLNPARGPDPAGLAAAEAARTTPYGVPVARTSPNPPVAVPAARPLRAAAGLLLLQVVAILGFSAFYLVELARGEGADAVQTLMSVVVFLVGAACLAVVARGLGRGAGWARTPAVLWNVFVLLICVSLAQSGQWALAVLVGAVAAAGIAATLAGRGAGRPPRAQGG